MSQSFCINIEEVVDLLSLERKPRQHGGAAFDVRCPFCGKFKMNVNTEKNVYHCFGCSSSGGTLDLYGRVKFGTGANQGQNTKELYKSLLEDLGEGNSLSASAAKHQTAAENYKEIYPAVDAALDKVYSALLRLPYLALTPAHRDNLLRRGLEPHEIAENGYASLPPAKGLMKLLDVSAESAFYAANHVETLRESSDMLLSREDLILGYKIADDLIGQGLSLAQIPGFFTLAGKWCLRVTPGMLIPTRNTRGQIVGIQTRLDAKTKGGLRYMTLSSKGFENGVTTHIARTHFPIHGDKLRAGVTIFLTEGPLKSDVIVSLLHRMGRTNFAVIALQGVNSTRDVPNIAKSLASRGITRIEDAFDIDKVLNPSVQQALRSVTETFATEGISLVPHYWDSEYAKMKYAQLAEICRNQGVCWTRTGGLFEDLTEMATLLSSMKLRYDFVTENGKTVQEKWRDSTKGMDDYLLLKLTSIPGNKSIAS